MVNNADYVAGRITYARPQGMLWSDNPGSLLTSATGSTMYVPTGYEVGQTTSGNNFLILSDDNRQPLDFTPTRLEQRQRMINGRMRSYHIADKLTLSTSWQMLPSRAFAGPSGFNLAVDPVSGKNYVANAGYSDYTSDGGAGGNEILEWYENHTGSFFVFLSYDKYTNFGDRSSSSTYGQLKEYSQVIEMFISDFNYSVQKRGGSNMDMWNISVTLEEV
jgi:hypothetical protein